MPFGFGRRTPQPGLAELVAEVRDLRAVVETQNQRLSDLELSGSQMPARPTPATPRPSSVLKAPVESKPADLWHLSPPRSHDELRLTPRQFALMQTVQLDGEEQISAVAVSRSILHPPRPGEPLGVPRYVAIAGSNGSLLLSNAAGRPLAPPVQLPAAVAALAFSATEPARLWAAISDTADSFLLQTYSLRAARQQQRVMDAADLSLEHETRVAWGGGGDEFNSELSSAGTGTAAAAAAVARPNHSLVAILPSWAPPVVSSGNTPRNAPGGRSRATLLVARSDGLVSLIDPSGAAAAASLPTGLASLTAVARSAHSLALASAERLLVLDLAQPGSPALVRECEIPQGAVGLIEDVAFDPVVPRCERFDLFTRIS